MKKFLLLFVLMVGFVSVAWAKLQAQTVEYKQGNIVLEGYCVYDGAVMEKRPGILVAPEAMGPNAYVKQRAHMLAQLGYVAFVVDFYGEGARPTTTEEADQLAASYEKNRPFLQERMLAAFNALKEQPYVDTARLGAIGYGFGGTAVLELARAGADLKGVVVFHGGLSNPNPGNARNIKAEVLVLHGEADPIVAKNEVTKFEKEMRDSNIKYSIIRYINVVHGFTNPDNRTPGAPVFYSPSAEQRSWNEMKNFFEWLFL